MVIIIKKDKYKIIESFLKKEKKLKELSKEYDVPYSTLKRWIKLYKELGKQGLKVKTRSDKDSFRKADIKVIEYIQNEHKKNPNLNISNLYKNYLEKFNNSDLNKVSYNTIYRIASKLDPFSQKHVKKNLKNIEKPNQIYRISTEKIYIENLGVNTRVVTIIILYDVYDDSIINYRIFEFTPSVNHYLVFIRDSILKNKIENYIVIPNIIVIDGFKITDKERFHQILEKTNININGTEDRNKEIIKFVQYLEEDIKKIFEGKKITIKSLNKDLEKYICNIVLREVPNQNRVYNFNILNYLLESTERKVQNYGIRFKNRVYNNENLKSYIGKMLILRYNPLDFKTLKVYLEDEFLFLLSVKVE